MDRARIAILGSVPIVMAFNLAMLNHYFGNPTKVVIKDKTNSYNYSDVDFNTENKNTYTVPEFFKNRKKIKIKRVPPPPAHTFAGFDE